MKGPTRLISLIIILILIISGVYSLYTDKSESSQAVLYIEEWSKEAEERIFKGCIKGAVKGEVDEKYRNAYCYCVVAEMKKRFKSEAESNKFIKENIDSTKVIIGEIQSVCLVHILTD